MRIITPASFTVYNYDELSEAAKDKAVENIREKLSGDWWDSSDIDDISDVIRWTLAEKLGTPGRDQYGVADFPGTPSVEVEGWELDGGRSMSVRGALTRENAPALPWVEGIGAVELEAARDHTRIYVTEAEPDCNCPPTSRTFEHESGCPTLHPFAVTDYERKTMEQAVLDAMSDALSAGQKEMDYKTSSEYAKEAIEANGWEFLEDGTHCV